MNDKFPSRKMALNEFYDFQELGVNQIQTLRSQLDDVYLPQREEIEIAFINQLSRLAVCGLVTESEVIKLLEYYRLTWSEYWPESYLNHKINSLFESPHISQRHPYEKHISLENAFDQANRCRQEGKRVVAVMGTFDFRSGHAELLTAAQYLAGSGVVFAFITSDKEARYTRPGENNILDSKNRLEMVACHQGVEFCIQLPRDDRFTERELFNAHMKQLHRQLGAHFRLIGELDERSQYIEEQCAAGGTTLIYRNNERISGLSSTRLRSLM